MPVREFNRLNCFRCNRVLTVSQEKPKSAPYVNADRFIVFDPSDESHVRIVSRMLFG